MPTFNPDATINHELADAKVAQALRGGNPNAAAIDGGIPLDAPEPWHYADGAVIPLPPPACGAPAAGTVSTGDPAKVTCRGCLLLLATD